MNPFRNLPLRKRLAVEFYTVLAAVLAINLVGAWSHHNLGQVDRTAMAIETRLFHVVRLDKEVTAIGRELSILVATHDAPAER